MLPDTLDGVCGGEPAIVRTRIPVRALDAALAVLCGCLMPVPARPADTTPDAERVQVDLLRRAPIARRLHLAMSLSSTVISLARRALARAYPDASARELDLRFVELHYGRDIAADLRAALDRRAGNT